MSFRGVVCGVPDEFCTGGKLVSNQIPSIRKYHPERNGAFRCMVRYLLNQGFEQVGNREFKDPVTGYVRVLTKKSHYG